MFKFFHTNMYNKNLYFLIIAILLFTTFAPIPLTLKHKPASSAFRHIISLTSPQNRTKVGLLTLKSATNASFYGFLVNADGLFLDRVSAFNKALGIIRRQIESRVAKNSSIVTSARENNDTMETPKPSKVEVIWGGDDNYLELMATRYRHITTVALPWQQSAPDLRSSGSAAQQPIAKWNSLLDFSNVLVQRYYQWTAESELCNVIETPGAGEIMRYDAVFNRSCYRDQVSAATRPLTIAPLFFYPKPINRDLYWPNNGDFYPASFYTDTPQFVFHLHIHQDAVVDTYGDVYSGNSALLPYFCRSPIGASLSLNTVPSLPMYSDVFTLTQYMGSAVFHRLVEVIPRIVVFIEFLLKNPDIQIQVPGSEGDQIAAILGILGIDQRRLVRGAVRGKIIYQPRPTGCGMANVQESQLASKLYRDYIARNLAGKNFIRDRLVLIKRSGGRRFTEHEQISSRLELLAAEFRLTYEVFSDSPTPSLADTMKLFNSAVMVVGPHGAGLSNLLFSEPGTYVVEGVCNLPHVNLCFQRLAHILGHRWHGVMSRGGCQDVVDASASSVIEAARKFLEHSKYVAKKPRFLS